MKKQLLLTIIFSLLLIFEMDGQVMFQKTYGGGAHERAYSVRQTNDGGYIITGWAQSFGGGSADVYLIKTNSTGDTLWTKTFWGPASDGGTCVLQTTDGGYMVTGWTDSYGTGDRDIYLIKTDANGDSIWTKTLGGIFYDDAWSLQQTTDGGYIMVGSTTSFGAGLHDIYLVKTDANGNPLWSKTFGGTDNEEGKSVQQTADGGYIIAGFTINFGAGLTDIYLIKTDANGDSLWTKTYGGQNNDNSYSVQQTADGGYIIAGFTQSFSPGNPDVYLIKTDANGNSLWTKIYGGTGSDYGNSVQQTIDGGYIVFGWTGSFGAVLDVYLIKTNAIGDTLWTKKYGGGIESEYGCSVQQTIDGGYILTGYTASFGSGNGDVYLIKTDSLGNSGCNEGNPATIVTIPPTQVSSPPTIVTSPTIIVTSPPTLVSSGGTATTVCTSVGIREQTADNSFQIYPNPVSNNNLNIGYLLPQNKSGTFQIYDITGKVVFKYALPQWSNEQSFTLPELGDGVYNCVITSGNERVSKKIAVIRDN